MARHATFQETTAHNHQEHEALRGELKALEAALAEVARVSAAAQAFVEEMKRQHVELQTQLEEFGTVIEQFPGAADLEEAVCRLKQKGEEFSRRMAAHMAAEERKVALLSVN